MELLSRKVGRVSRLWQQYRMHLVTIVTLGDVSVIEFDKGVHSQVLFSSSEINHKGCRDVVENVQLI